MAKSIFLCNFSLGGECTLFIFAYHDQRSFSLLGWKIAALFNEFCYVPTTFGFPVGWPCSGAGVDNKCLQDVLLCVDFAAVFRVSFAVEFKWMDLSFDAVIGRMESVALASHASEIYCFTAYHELVTFS